MSGRVPGYWMHETSGVLRPAVEAYLNDLPMTDGQIVAMRAYLRQWINGGFRGPIVEELRERIDSLTTQHAIKSWLTRADYAGVDPL